LSIASGETAEDMTKNTDSNRKGNFLGVYQLLCGLAGEFMLCCDRFERPLKISTLIASSSTLAFVLVTRE
jgi:hypothetical protein